MIKLIDILKEIKVVPGGVMGIFILKTIWIDYRNCNVDVNLFRSEKAAEDYALTIIWEIMFDDGKTELSKEEFLSTYSFDDYIDGTIGYSDPVFEIEKAK